MTKAFIAFGARHISALPAQSCLSAQPGRVTAAVYERDCGIDLTLRLSEQDGIGLAIMPVLSHPEVSKGEGYEPGETAAHEVIQALCAVVPAAPITIYVPQAALHAYQEAVAGTLALKERINVSADNWTCWIAGARNGAPDLMAGLGANTGHRLDWHAWRWPLVLGTAVLLINISALNIDWWRMKSEADSLRSAMIYIYKSAYPNESVIIDPFAQMQQKIAAAKRDSGLAAPDDFTAITAAFGEAWASVSATLATPPSIAALEYRERSLFVRLKPVLSHPEVSKGEGPGEAPTQQMQAALAKRDLSLGLAPEQSGAVVWQIRGAK